jgi:hypothetical protein
MTVSTSPFPIGDDIPATNEESIFRASTAICCNAASDE